MEQMKVSHCFTEMADALEISQSGFHAHERKEERPRRQEEKELWQAIEPIFMASRRNLRQSTPHACAAQKGMALRQKSHRPAHALTRSARQAKTAV
jgi:hypothetical protein